MLNVANDEYSPPPLPEAPQRRRRWGWVVLGIVLTLLGLMVTITGAIAGLASDTAASIDPDGEARTPDTIRFEADARNYEVMLVGGRRSVSSSVADSTTCEVRLANERRITLDGSRQGVSSTNANIASIGNFDAVEGITTVDCNAGGRQGVRYIVDSTSRLEAAAIWLLIAGCVVIGIGVSLLLAGIFWKKPART
jgi:hypothetical protein